VLGVFDSTRGTFLSLVGDVEVTSLCKLISSRIYFNIYSDIIFLYGTS